MNEAKCAKLPIFAERFGELRGDRTQAEFAEFLGISRPTIGFYENGERVPDALVLRQIAKKCEVTTDYLVGLSDNKTYTNANIGEETGLSDEAITLLRTANEKKKTAMQKKDADRYYPTDIFSLIIENLNYFPDLVLTFSRELSINTFHADAIDALEAEKYLIRNKPEIYKKICKNGDFLLGSAYKEYLRGIIERNFGMLARFISGKINPCEFDVFIRQDIKNRSVNTLLDRLTGKVGKREEGAINADDPEAR